MKKMKNIILDFYEWVTYLDLKGVFKRFYVDYFKYLLLLVNCFLKVLFFGGSPRVTLQAYVCGKYGNSSIVCRFVKIIFFWQKDEYLFFIESEDTVEQIPLLYRVVFIFLLIFLLIVL